MRRSVITRIKNVIMKKAKNRELTLLVLLGLMLIQAGCSREPRKTRPDETNAPVDNNQEVVSSTTDVEHTMPTVNLFIENSASMDGYIKGFKPAIKNLVVDLKKDYPIGLNFVNNAVYPQTIALNQDPIEVVSNMFDNKFSNTGNRSTTKLNDIIKLVLEQTNDSTISILVSDCIYSVKDKKKPTNEEKLKDLMVETKNQFSNKYSTIDELSVLFIRLMANFKGQYYDYNDAPISLIDCERPYYMCIIGTDNNVRTLMHSINIEELEGYSSHFYLSGKDLSNTFYTAVSKPFNREIFPIENNATVKPRHNSGIGFAIAINLNEFPMTEDEKINLDNYLIDGEFVLEQVVAIDNNILFSPNEKNKVKNNNCSHLLVVTSNGCPSDFTIRIKRTIPRWVTDYSSLDDTRIKNSDEELGKTFGICYFINGIADAFRVHSKDKDSYFTMSIKIKH